MESRLGRRGGKYFRNGVGWADGVYVSRKYGPHNDRKPVMPLRSQR